MLLITGEVRYGEDGLDYIGRSSVPHLPSTGFGVSQISQPTLIPATPLCKVTTSQAGCPSSSFEPASGAANVAGSTLRRLVTFFLSDYIAVSVEKLEVQMRSFAPNLQKPE